MNAHGEARTHADFGEFHLHKLVQKIQLRPLIRRGLKYQYVLDPVS